MSVILGLVEHDGEAPTSLSLEMLTFGRDLAERLNLPLHGILIGREGRAAAGRLGAFGVSAAHVAELDGVDDYAPGAWAQGLVELIDAHAPEAVLAPGSDRGNEVMAHLAARADLPMVAGVTDVRPQEPWQVTRQRWGGSLLEEARLRGTVKLLTVAPHAVQTEESTVGGEIAIDAWTPTLSDDDRRVRVSGRVEADADRVSLPEARVVVGGGRGVGSPQGFAALEELAGLLGGTVGVSRVVTSLGWRPHSDQVGQTGTRIAPDIYIACGISGAIQHMVGCKGAKHILAINSDPEAPIVAKADSAIIGDLTAIVPALSAEIRKARGGSG